VGTGPSCTPAVPSVGAQRRYAGQSAVNPVLSRVPFTLFPLPPQKKKGSSAESTRDLQEQGFGFGLLSPLGRAATTLGSLGCAWAVG